MAPEPRLHDGVLAVPTSASWWKDVLLSAVCVHTVPNKGCAAGRFEVLQRRVTITNVDQVSGTARTTEPYPGFYFPEEVIRNKIIPTLRLVEQLKSDATNTFVQSGPITFGPLVASATTGPSVAVPSRGPTLQRTTTPTRAHHSSSSSDDRLSSPDLDWDLPEPTNPQPPQQQPDPDRASVDFNALFVPDCAEPPTMELAGNEEQEVLWSDEKVIREIGEVVGGEGGKEKTDRVEGKNVCGMNKRGL
jgi:hypothetical protein